MTVTMKISDFYVMIPCILVEAYRLFWWSCCFHHQWTLSKTCPFFLSPFITQSVHYKTVGRDSSIGVATGYGLDGLDRIPVGGEIFRTRPDRPWGPRNLLYNGYWVFPGGKAAGAYRRCHCYGCIVWHVRRVWCALCELIAQSTVRPPCIHIEPSV
jgi:hypothetical protein